VSLGADERDGQYTSSEMITCDERQHPMFQAEVEMHMRTHVPFLKIVSLHTMLSKLRVTKAQLIFVHVMHFVAPLTIGRSAANDEAHPVDDTTTPHNVNVNQPKASYY
jgi:hypothetical protein